jgi:predicted metal-dependent HD superfamily phosphohydrolase
MINNRIIYLTGRFVTDLFEKQLPEWAHYHNIEHTRKVVSECRKIGKVLKLDDNDLEVLTVAGWFHDTGYIRKRKSNETEGAAIARAFLQKEKLSRPMIQKVVGCIMATKMPQRPRNILQKVICDADLASLGKKTFLRENELFRRETIESENSDFDLRRWLLRTETLLDNHRFHTSYGKKILERGRLRNIGIIRKLIEKMDARGDRSTVKRTKGNKLYYLPFFVNASSSALFTISRAILANRIA